MLTLGVKVGESVWIHLEDGRKVEIFLDRIDGTRTVKLAFDAPLEIGIHRSSHCDSEGNLIGRQK